jgi:hypothetical protein
MSRADERLENLAIHRIYVAYGDTELSCVRRLPTELLRDIFILFCRSLFPRRADLFLLSAVCRRWRELVLSMPELWANIHILYGCKPLDDYVDMINLLIARSQVLPLSIRLDHIPDRGDMHAILLAAINHLERWRHFTLRCESFNINISDFPSECHAPLLESLTVISSEFPSRDLFHLIQSLVHDAPRLRSIEVKISRFDNYLDVFPWRQLKCLQIRGGLSVMDCIVVLSQALQIEECSFYVSAMGGPTSSLPPCITLHHLEGFVIGSTVSIADLLDHLSVPALWDLVIGSVGSDSFPWSRESFSSFINRSSSPLRDVRIEISLLEEDIIRCLQDLSSTLVNLELHARHMTDRVVKLLTFEEHNTSRLCPHLECITLWGYLRTTHGVFASMAESRWNVDDLLASGEVSRLRRVVLDHSCKKKDVARLKRLEEEGLVLVFANRGRLSM